MTRPSDRLGVLVRLNPLAKRGDVVLVLSHEGDDLARLVRGDAGELDLSGRDAPGSPIETNRMNSVWIQKKTTYLFQAILLVTSVCHREEDR